MTRKRIIAVTGGIGAGKSTVCRMLRTMGYPVYDCDREARRLQDGSAELRRRIAEEVTAEALNEDGTLNRPALAKVVFSDAEKLAALNHIVHTALAKHLQKWLEKQTAETVFIETAILYESGLDRLVTEVWEVTAPQETRIERVKTRSGLSAEQVLERMSAQGRTEPRLAHHIILNDGKTPLLPQILHELTL